MRTYLVSYDHEGSRWNIELKARDIADARARLSQLGQATLDGELAPPHTMTVGRKLLAIMIAACAAWAVLLSLVWLGTIIFAP